MDLRDLFWGSRVVAKGVITVNAAATSGTATISAVTLANAFVLPAGQSGADFANGSFHLELTDSTTVTATRNGSASTGKVAFVVIELR